MYCHILRYGIMILSVSGELQKDLSYPIQNRDILLLDSYHRSLMSNGVLLCTKPLMSASHLLLISLLQWHFQIMRVTEGASQAVELTNEWKSRSKGPRARNATNISWKTLNTLLWSKLHLLCDWCSLHTLFWSRHSCHILRACMFITHKHRCNLRHKTRKQTHYSGA